MICPYCKREITPKPLSPLGILLEEIAVKNGVSVEELRAPWKFPDLVRVRREFAVQAQARGYSTTRIGNAMNRHHSTVVHLLRKKK